IGEITLATLAQMGMGVVLLNFLQNRGVPFAAVVPIVAVLSVPVSLLIGVFALRLRGVYFAIATLAFAALAQKTFFQSYLGAEGGFEKPIARPSFVSSDYRLYYLIMAFLLVVAYFALAVVGGLGSIGGAIAAGLVFGSVPKYFDTVSQGHFVGYDQFFAGAVALLTVLTVPGGLAEIGRRTWRRVEGRAR